MKNGFLSPSFGVKNDGTGEGSVAADEVALSFTTLELRCRRDASAAGYTLEHDSGRRKRLNAIDMIDRTTTTLLRAEHSCSFNSDPIT